MLWPIFSCMWATYRLLEGGSAALQWQSMLDPRRETSSSYHKGPQREHRCLLLGSIATGKRSKHESVQPLFSASDVHRASWALHSAADAAPLPGAESWFMMDIDGLQAQQSRLFNSPQVLNKLANRWPSFKVLLKAPNSSCAC